MDANTTGSVLGIGLTTAWAFWERWKNGRKSDQLAALAGKDQVIQVKEEVIASLKDKHAFEISEAKAQQEKEHKEYLDYRDVTHKKSEDTNLKLLMLTDENATLRARSDMTPILSKLEEFGKVLIGVAKMMETLAEKLESKYESTHT